MGLHPDPVWDRRPRQSFVSDRVRRFLTFRPLCGQSLVVSCGISIALSGLCPSGVEFPGATSRVPRDLPRVILGRPFGAAITRAQCRRIRDCPSASPCRGSPPWLPIRFERGHVVASRASRVPQAGKKRAPGFNPGIDVAPRSSPVGTTESASGPRCIWDHIRSRAVWETSTISLYAFCDDGMQADRSSIGRHLRLCRPYGTWGF